MRRRSKRNLKKNIDRFNTKLRRPKEKVEKYADASHAARDPDGFKGVWNRWV